MRAFYKSLLCVSFLLGVLSCEDNLDFEEGNSLSLRKETTLEVAQLGEKVKNPYSLSVMQAAYNELVGDTSLCSSTVLEPTHIYLRFLPKNIEELRVLEKDTNLFLYSHPLDVKIADGSGNYHDPLLPDSVPTYQYVCVPVDYKLPQVEYEVLDEIYFVDDEVGESSLRSSGKIAWRELEEKAYAMVGDTLPPTELRSSQWRAGGTIYYYDNKNNQTQPLTGVPVRMRYYIVTYQCCTDLEGRFSCETSRRGDCEYSIVWKRDPFRIRPVSGNSTAEFTIRTATSTISYTFHPSNNETQWFHASIFRAAHHMYYGNLYGLNRPENDLEIRASNYPDRENSGGNYSSGGSTEIHIYRYFSSGGMRTSLDYYGNTIHELAHSIHCNIIGRSRFDAIGSNSYLKESWAVGVSNYFAIEKYSTWCFRSYAGPYTGVVDDLVDNDVRASNGWWNRSYVSGYSLGQIQNALSHSDNWNQFKNNIKLIRNNESENESIENLFDVWTD